MMTSKVKALFQKTNKQEKKQQTNKPVPFFESLLDIENQNNKILI